MKIRIKPWGWQTPSRGQSTHHRTHHHGARGFTLLELLIVLLLSSGLVLMCFNLLMADGQLVGRMAGHWRQRQERERALDLIRHDLVQGDQVLLNPQQASHRCSMRRRQPVLAITTEVGIITYAIGPAPSQIWTGPVLMRCGPAFTKEGNWSQKSFQNRVLVDGLESPTEPWKQCPVTGGVNVADSFALPLAICMEPATGLVTVRLSQGQSHSIASTVVGLNRYGE